MRFLQAVLFPLICGAILGFVHIPFVASWLAFLPLALIFYLIARQPRPRNAFSTAFFAGVGFWAAHLFWLPASFAPFFGGLVWAIFPLVWLGEALFWAIAAWLVKFLAKGFVPTLIGLGCAFLVLEWMRSLGPLGFPWGDFGYTLIDTPLAQVASLGGVHLASFLVIGLAVAVAALARRRFIPLMVMMPVSVAALIFGLSRPPAPTPSEKALLVQGNIDPLRRTSGIGQYDIDIYQKLSQNAQNNQLVVWPEAAVPASSLTMLPIPKLVSGAQDASRGFPAVNIVSAVTNGQIKDTYAKVKLVPFGEFFPFRKELSFIYDPIFKAFGLPGYPTAQSGTGLRVLALNGEKIGAYICYESIFPEVARNFANQGANVLVNVSNDGWFGDTAGTYQHFAMGRMRAIEQNRYILRAANTGITAVIDSKGQIKKILERKIAATLPVEYALIQEKTLYARFGEWIIVFSVVFGLTTAFISRRPNLKL